MAAVEQFKDYVKVSFKHSQDKGLVLPVRKFQRVALFSASSNKFAPPRPWTFPLIKTTPKKPAGFKSLFQMDTLQEAAQGGRLHQITSLPHPLTVVGCDAWRNLNQQYRLSLT